MNHTCSIRGRHHECDIGADCDYPEVYPMNCGIKEGNPIHQDEYRKAMEEKHD